MLRSVLSSSEVDYRSESTAEQIRIASTGWHDETPMWYYLLREADVCAGGRRLGPVVGRNVAEALVALIDADQIPHRRSSRDWHLQKQIKEFLGI